MTDKKTYKFNCLLVTGEVYHICTKSIAGFKIFNSDYEFARTQDLYRYYEFEKPLMRFSYFSRRKQIKGKEKENYFKGSFGNTEKIVDILAYCIMPTHIHLILKQLKEKGISVFMKNVLNSYTRYFNTKHKRKGPLWEGRFRRAWVGTDEYLLHLTRYIHLNPVTAYLANKPEKWKWSSYGEYISKSKSNNICRYQEILDINLRSYKKFVEDNRDYQRQLAKIKHLTLE
ncbi:MAG: transposase [Candidatus Omnitrophota bacterium]